MLLKKGTKAKAFSLPDEQGKTRSLKDYLGSWVILYFYPKDDTPGCTAEACQFRENFPKFKQMKVKVLGVSVDPPKKHKKFIEKYGLPFTLLADEDKSVVNLYGVWGKKKFMGRDYMGIFRTSYLIDPAGKIRKVYENVKPDLHADEVLGDMKEMR